MNSIKKQRGFTIIELMIVIVIMAIMAMWAVPAYTKYIAQKRVDGAVAELITSFQLAKSHAMTIGRPVQICASSGGETPTCAGVAVTDWSTNGWLLWDDQTKEVIQVYQSSGINITMSAAKSYHYSVSINGTGAWKMDFVVKPKSSVTGTSKNLAISSSSLKPEITDIPG